MSAWRAWGWYQGSPLSGLRWHGSGRPWQSQTVDAHDRGTNSVTSGAKERAVSIPSPKAVIGERLSGRQIRCPACGGKRLEEFHAQESIPVNSCLLMNSREEALAYPIGDLRLDWCRDCGFIFNSAFDPELTKYSAGYEETQAFSARFVEFARELVDDWVERDELRGKVVFEIGCGKGEFLVMMAEAGIGRGIGIDPGVKPERIRSPLHGRLEWIPGFFSDGYGPIEADAIVCRHTLEHIQPVAEFLAQIRRAIGDRQETVLLFELPDVQRVLDEAAFWDIYYEHCSYFTEGSLARLFERSGFEVLDLARAYEDQYLLLEARPVSRGAERRLWDSDDMNELEVALETFSNGYDTVLRRWEERLSAVRNAGGCTVIWGGGSKGVAFLSAVGDTVEAAVDINPYKRGMFMAGTGHPIIAPEELARLEPNLVIVMNSVYLDEIREQLVDLGIETELVAL